MTECSPRDLQDTMPESSYCEGSQVESDTQEGPTDEEVILVPKRCVRQREMLPCLKGLVEFIVPQGTSREKLPRVLYEKIGYVVAPTFQQWCSQRDRPWSSEELLELEAGAKAVDTYLEMHPETANRNECARVIMSIVEGSPSPKRSKSTAGLRRLYAEARRQRWMPLVLEPYEFPPDMMPAMGLDDLVEGRGHRRSEPDISGPIDYRQILVGADAILFGSLVTRMVFCLYGADKLASDGSPPVGVNAVLVSLNEFDRRGRQLGRFATIVERIKGCQDSQRQS